MSRPTVGSYAELLYERLGPLADADEENSWPLLGLCGAHGQVHQLIQDLTSDTEEHIGWSQLFDVDTCPTPFLPYLAQYVGVRIPVGTPETAARELIRTPSGFVRGSPAAMRAAAQKYLSGTKYVGFIERNESAYALLAITRKGETPKTEWPQVNLVTNPRAYIDLTDWIKYGLLFMVRVPLPSGTGVPAIPEADSAIMCAADNPGDSGYITVSVEAGKTYTFSAWVWIQYSYFTADGVALGVWLGSGPVYSSTFSLTERWERISVSFIAEATGDLDLSVEQTGTGAVNYYYTAVHCEEDGLGKYFDGDSNGCSWRGTPHQSASDKPATTNLVRNALLSQKPAGIVLTHVVTDVTLIDELVDDIDSQTGTIDDL